MLTYYSINYQSVNKRKMLRKYNDLILLQLRKKRQKLEKKN